MEKIISYINKVTFEKSWFSALLRLFSFVVSAVFSVVLIYVNDENFYNAFLVFLIPILFDLGINTADVFRNKEKNVGICIAMILLMIIYLVLACVAFLANSGVESITSFLTTYRLIFTLFVFSYSYAYCLEFICLTVKAVLLKKLHRENELVII